MDSSTVRNWLTLSLCEVITNRIGLSLNQDASPTQRHERRQTLTADVSELPNSS